MSKSLPPFDQRWVRSVPPGFKLGCSHFNLCDVCGRSDQCDVRAGLDYIKASQGIETRIEMCPAYVPVISFNDDTGLDKTFNTFRRGQGWHRRVQVGTRVRLWTTELEAFVGYGRVTETHYGTLGSLLEDHASMNHLLRDGNYSDAEARLLKILVQIYGKNYSTLDKQYSVIYVDPT